VVGQTYQERLSTDVMHEVSARVRPAQSPIRRVAGSGRPGRRSSGQAIAEFALVVPILFLTLAGIIQFGLIFWSQQTLTQVARDTGRWAATQDTCSDHTLVATEANDIAVGSTLFGYEASEWSASNDIASSASNQVAVDWDPDSGICPPEDNQAVYFVRVRINHTIPIFFPFVPGNGELSTSAEFRMEPGPT